MAIDLKGFNQKKIILLIVALAAASAAVALMNVHINRSIERGSYAEELRQTAQRVQSVEQNTQALYERQEEIVRQLQQQIQSMQKSVASAPAPVAREDAPVVRESLSVKTPPGKRALTLRIQTLQAVGGLLTPGDFVDILAHLNVPPDIQGLVAEEKNIITLFQNIQILAVGSNTAQVSNFEEQQRAATLSITLAVEPQEAEILNFVEKHGQLQLVLRSPAEKTTYQSSVANWNSFIDFLSKQQGIKLGESAPKLGPSQTVSPPPAIEIIRGGQR